MDNKDLLEAINQKMPYGKYQGRKLVGIHPDIIRFRE